jgi:predicted O-methyltransferase YrrM
LVDETLHLNPPPILTAIQQATRDQGFDMASEPLTGSLLRTLAASKPGGRLLEMGTGTGLATAWLLDGMDSRAHLTSVDNDPAVQAVAQAHLGGDARVHFVLQDGDEFLHASLASTTAGRPLYDLIFADTWPGKYRLLEEILALLAPGGLYLIDDMLPQANWPTGHPPKVAALIAQLEAQPDLYVTKPAWASGLILVARRLA